jgi:hypothetical protein
MVKLTMEGDGFWFEREISENEALKVQNIIITDEENEATPEVLENTAGTPGKNGFELTDHFFEHLTSGQDALIRVLLNSENWVESDEALDRMDEQYNHTAGNSRAIGGIQAGLSRKYGDNDLIRKKNVEGRKAYKLNSKYTKELRERLD